MKPFYILSALLLLGCCTLWAQEEAPNEDDYRSPCIQMLEKAQDLYSAGLLQEVPDLTKCINEEFESEDQIEALRLQTWVALYKDDYATAEAAMQRILTIDPGFKPQRLLDPAEFQYLYETFDVRPKGYVNLSLGISVAQEMFWFTRVQTLGVEEGGFSLPFPGLHAGASFEKPIGNKGLHLLIGGAYTQRIMSFQELTRTGNAELNPAQNFIEVKFLERQHWAEIPIGLNYHRQKAFRIRLGEKKLEVIPTGYLGLTAHGLVAANLGNIRQFDRTRFAENMPGEQFFLEKMSLFGTGAASVRNRFNLSPTVGLGCLFKTGYNFVQIDGKLNGMIFNQANANGRYSNPTLLYGFGYLSDDFWQSSLMISLTYKYTLYRPEPKSKH